jgi:rhamnosyltransferase
MTTEHAPSGGMTEFAKGGCVCAVIVTYNIGHAVHRCFDSIYDQVAHVIIVDNGSDEITRGELNKLASENSATIILNEKNEGIAQGLNQGIKRAIGRGYPWVLTLDHDSEATRGMVEELLQATQVLYQEGRRDVAIVGTNPLDRNVGLFLKDLPPDGDSRPVEVDHLISSGSLINCEVFNKVGFFDKALFMYCVDDDFCLRLRRAGWKLFLCPRAVLLHNEGSRRRRRFLWREALYDGYGKQARYYLTRNYIYILRRYHPGGRSFYGIAKRLLKDYVKVVLYGEAPVSQILFGLRGLFDALRNRYGPFKSGKE